MQRGTRKQGSTAWNVWRVIVGGVIYLGAVIFNSVYTLPLASQPGVFEGYAEGAWFGFLADFVRTVLEPNAQLFMTLVILFELTVGFLILSHGRLVDLGVAASLAWVLGILPFLAWPYLLVNIALMFVQAAVLFRTYDSSVWSLIRSAARFGGVGHRTQT